MIADKLKYYRAINGYTQRDIALCAGVKPGVIGQIERRNRDVYLSTVVKIANALEIKIEQLLSPLTDNKKEKMKNATHRIHEIRCDKRSKQCKEQKYRYHFRIKNDVHLPR